VLFFTVPPPETVNERPIDPIPGDDKEVPDLGAGAVVAPKTQEMGEGVAVAPASKGSIRSSRRELCARRSGIEQGG
jgi:hypothetical protein